jgi:hypothetical protein
MLKYFQFHPDRAWADTLKETTKQTGDLFQVIWEDYTKDIKLSSLSLSKPPQNVEWNEEVQLPNGNIASNPEQFCWGPLAVTTYPTFSDLAAGL